MRKIAKIPFQYQSQNNPNKEKEKSKNFEPESFCYQYNRPQEFLRKMDQKR